MDDSSASAPPAVVEAVPINIAPSTEGAPPTLAEPASGPVATISGALQGPDAAEAPKSTVDTTSAVINGPTKTAAEPAPADAKPSGPTSTSAVSMNDDEDMNDEAVPAANTEEPEADSTPATSSKKQSNGKRKSTGGVPEHKSKKLNKKKSMQKITHLDAQPGDYYFARLKSYPPWPSIICDEEMLPQSLTTTRPVTTKQHDGTYRADYADGGRKAHERTYPIMFLQTNEFAWIPNTDLAPLDPAEVKDFSEKSKTKSLIGAYNVAAEAHPLQYFKDMLLDHQKAMQEDQELREQREAAKAAKAGKKKRKSEAADEDVEMDDVDADEEVENKKSSKKRKKDVESEGDEEKPTKTPKTAQKLKLTTPKAPGTTEKKETTKSAKPKSERKKPTKAAASDEEMADDEVKEPTKPVDPVQERKDREKEVLFLRHKLQKGFLTRDQAPQESEMAAMSNFIKKLEGYGDLEAGIIRATKINKVLKALIKLNTIPKDEEFNFRGRSVELLGKWNKLLGTDGTGDENGAGPSSAVEKDDRPTTNGTHKEDKELELADKSGEAPAELPDSAKAVKAAPEASSESREVVVDSLVKQVATESGLADVQETEAEPKHKETEPVKLDQAPVSAEGAAEALEVTKATE